ncbi:hypothetical protein BAZ12_08975 [Elizabethkingia miricola]|uniref:Uncharacterized protein n=2 Tax=Bacteroidota TaxID=976 RepID=A0A2X2JTL0_SPHMU|nr:MULTISPECIES: hypothetical protein [Bacteroidota]AZB25192.1 hypothetical protein EG339_11670 [Chryseobacterium bernardetii]OPC69945.1 hypothetical protein BAZ12_08975 [Elizabethkingia miricola]QRQ63284.1 hypothetical protein I6J33_10060 [Sphingobacterium multivorum]SPZ95153.1 Uncharacterised protein [Sphingobacterium multivorum]
MGKFTSAKKKKSINAEMLKHSTFIELEEIPFEQFLETVRSTGRVVSEEEAKEMLEILYTLARITIKQFFSPD